MIHFQHATAGQGAATAQPLKRGWDPTCGSSPSTSKAAEPTQGRRANTRPQCQQISKAAEPQLSRRANGCYQRGFGVLSGVRPGQSTLSRRCPRSGSAPQHKAAVPKNSEAAVPQISKAAAPTPRPQCQYTCRMMHHINNGISLANLCKLQYLAGK